MTLHRAHKDFFYSYFKKNKSSRYRAVYVLRSFTCSYLDFKIVILLVGKKSCTHFFERFQAPVHILSIFLRPKSKKVYNALSCNVTHHRMIIDSRLVNAAIRNANWINYIIEDVESVSHNEITLGLSILVGLFMSWFEFTQSLGMKMA